MNVFKSTFIILFVYSFGIPTLIFIITIASGFRDLIPPAVSMSIYWLFMVGGIIFASISIKIYKKRTQKILAEMKQDLKYCFSCGGTINTPSEERCPHCGYKFPIGDLNVLII